MIKIKYLGIITIASSTFLFSGCVQQPDTFSQQNRYYNNVPQVNVSLVSYAYPYYYDRPFYYLGGQYYYGGYYRNGFYHYGNRRFRHGHYYSRGNRYYNGRRYRAMNGQHGYYRNRSYYQRSHTSRRFNNKVQSQLDRGRNYNTHRNTSHRDYNTHVTKGHLKSVIHKVGKSVVNKSHIGRNSSRVQRVVRRRPAR